MPPFETEVDTRDPETLGRLVRSLGWVDSDGFLVLKWEDFLQLVWADTKFRELVEQNGKRAQGDDWLEKNREMIEGCLALLKIRVVD